MALLPIKPSRAFIGATVGAGLFLLLHLLLHTLWLVLLIYGAVVLLAYILGSVTVGNSAGELFRGLLIGACAAVNWAIAASLFGTLVAIVLGALVFVAAIGVLSRSALYQGLLAYCNWLLPLSWPVVALGFTFFLLGLLGAVIIGLPGVAFFKIGRIVFDWKTGTLFTRGGWISNLNPIDTAFNMGNFAFIDVKFSQMAIDHEAGHTLNLAAFGSVFHLLGALDENVLRGANALSECLAESHVPGSTGPLLAMWA